MIESLIKLLSFLISLILFQACTTHNQSEQSDGCDSIYVDSSSSDIDRFTFVNDSLNSMEDKDLIILKGIYLKMDSISASRVKLEDKLRLENVDFSIHLSYYNDSLLSLSLDSNLTPGKEPSLALLEIYKRFLHKYGKQNDIKFQWDGKLYGHQSYVSSKLDSISDNRSKYPYSNRNENIPNNYFYASWYFNKRIIEITYYADSIIWPTAHDGMTIVKANEHYLRIRYKSPFLAIKLWAEREEQNLISQKAFERHLDSIRKRNDELTKNL